MWRRLLLWLLALAGLTPAAAWADERGWDYLIDKLTADGIGNERVIEMFRDPRVGPFTGLDFSPYRPREPRSLYRRLLRPSSVAAARRCRASFADAFESAERLEGVPASMLTAILYVESGCGHNTGSHLIFARLARLAMANAPDNLQRNLIHYSDGDGNLPPTLEAQIRQRARELEDTFYPEVRALFTIADRTGVGPLEIRGSSAGAFGYPQFLPTSYIEDGVDADADGQVSLYDPADAIASCARYFVHHGWRPALPLAEKRAVIYRYNRSEAYVDTILSLAARIGGARAPAPVLTRKRAPAHKHPRRGVRHA
jgi:membrane-bound lytic murein transglycosylase B